MSVIESDYLPEPERVEFPPELALLIVRKAQAMAVEFEEKALDEMMVSSRRALQRGVDPVVIARQMGLIKAAA